MPIRAWLRNSAAFAYRTTHLKEITMEEMFAQRMASVPRSFIREILKVSLDPEIISFAGGLPNRKYFPVRGIEAATSAVFAEYGADALQYNNSEGIPELKELIASRYRATKGIEIPVESILITTGSQQALDLVGKVMINEGDAVLIEEPGYLGAIQSLSMYGPNFQPVPVSEEGIDTEALAVKADESGAKLLYTVPNFQNPSGVTYTNATREKVAALVRENGIVLVEDDPYGELRFSGAAQKSFYHYCPERTVLLGSFSKIVAPGFRVGWLVAPEPLYEKLLIAKQAADLHTASVSQYILARYLKSNDLDSHLKIIINAYGEQCKTMVASAAEYLPQEVTLWEPDGGMFLWGQLPAGYDAMELFAFAVKEKVVFVPGAAFYTSDKGKSTFRLNFSCTEPAAIKEGMQRLARAFEQYRNSIACAA